VNHLGYRCTLAVCLAVGNVSCDHSSTRASAASLSGTWIGRTSPRQGELRIEVEQSASPSGIPYSAYRVRSYEFAYSTEGLVCRSSPDVAILSGHHRVGAYPIEANGRFKIIEGWWPLGDAPRGTLIISGHFGSDTSASGTVVFQDVICSVNLTLDWTATKQ
jgi:hypothetical protein